jgi:hypothetical protein
MLHRPSILNVALTLLTVLAIAGMGFGAAGMPREGCAVSATAGVRDSDSPCPQACCCGTTASPRACGCDRDEETPAWPPPPPDDWRSAKWSPGIDAAKVVPLTAASENEAPALNRLFYSPPQRSLQSLLCVWRI